MADEAERPDYAARGRELNRLLRLPFEAKLQRSREVVRRASEQCSRPVIASSFGKDSTALIHLVQEVVGDYSTPVVTTDTGQMFPETRRYMDEMRQRWGLEIHVLHPEETYWEIVARGAVRLPAPIAIQQDGRSARTRLLSHPQAGADATLRP